ncbi:hypothetical protein FOS14_18130 [Skermania sp. ID1734]|uniref:hypothetical protein n=1 Tax=Skermania sp. ID1734 TaxID=2597516 RepID=UPI00117BE36E|nr:hypothetical protein [Skermania sp. ID1734]TSD95284.1 hypothetical protein FOS14_18130 [Skermania sp. ID1734]
MTLDALDPGPNGDFPYLPRTPDGYLDTNVMPIGIRRQRTPDGRVVEIDVTPTVLIDGAHVPITSVLPPPPSP